MSNEPNKPIEAEELTEKELEGVVGGVDIPMGLIAPAAINEKMCIAIREGGRTAGCPCVVTEEFK